MRCLSESGTTAFFGPVRLLFKTPVSSFFRRQARIAQGDAVRMRPLLNR